MKTCLLSDKPVPFLLLCVYVLSILSLSSTIWVPMCVSCCSFSFLFFSPTAHPSLYSYFLYCFYRLHLPIPQIYQHWSWACLNTKVAPTLTLGTQEQHCPETLRERMTEGYTCTRPVSFIPFFSSVPCPYKEVRCSSLLSLHTDLAHPHVPTAPTLPTHISLLWPDSLMRGSSYGTTERFTHKYRF